MADEHAAYVRAHLERRRRAREALGGRAALAREQAEAAARRIGQRTGARRVLLFGSLVRGTFHERSDIDLAVEGLPPGGLLDALAAADGSAFRFDVIPLEIAPPYIREAAEKEGVVLWPR